MVFYCTLCTGELEAHKLVNPESEARNLQILLVASQHPVWVFYAGKPKENGRLNLQLTHIYRMRCWVLLCWQRKARLSENRKLFHNIHQVSMNFRAERNCTSGINFISNEMTKDTKRSIKRTTVPQSTGKNPKFPWIFWCGICMDIAISTINENPNMVILWFSEAELQMFLKIHIKSTMGYSNFHLYHGYKRNQVKNVNFHVWKTVWYPAMAIQNSTVIMEMGISKLFQLGYLNSIDGNCSKF